jgi:hypothetical protein
MQAIEAQRDAYGRRVLAIGSWVRELGRQIARLDLSVEIDAEVLAFIRTSHTVTIRGEGGEQAVLLTKEEFWNEYQLFERSAAPRLRAAVERMCAE